MHFCSLAQQLQKHISHNTPTRQRTNAESKPSSILLRTGNPCTDHTRYTRTMSSKRNSSKAAGSDSSVGSSGGSSESESTLEMLERNPRLDEMGMGNSGWGIYGSIASDDVSSLESASFDRGGRSTRRLVGPPRVDRGGRGLATQRPATSDVGVGTDFLSASMDNNPSWTDLGSNQSNQQLQSARYGGARTAAGARADSTSESAETGGRGEKARAIRAKIAALQGQLRDIELEDDSTEGSSGVDDRLLMPPPPTRPPAASSAGTVLLQGLTAATIQGHVARAMETQLVVSKTPGMSHDGAFDLPATLKKKLKSALQTQSRLGKSESHGYKAYVAECSAKGQECLSLKEWSTPFTFFGATTGYSTILKRLMAGYPPQEAFLGFSARPEPSDLLPPKTRAEAVASHNLYIQEHVVQEAKGDVETMLGWSIKDVVNSVPVTMDNADISGAPRTPVRPIQKRLAKSTGRRSRKATPMTALSTLSEDDLPEKASVIFMAKCRARVAELEAEALQLETAREMKTSKQERIAQHGTEVDNAAEQCKKEKMENANNMTRMHEEVEAEYARAVTKSARKMVRSAKRYEDSVVEAALYGTNDEVGLFCDDEATDDRDELADDDL